MVEAVATMVHWTTMQNRTSGSHTQKHVPQILLGDDQSIMCKGDPVRCSVGSSKKFYFYNDIYLFLTRIATSATFPSFDFEPDAKEMNKIFSKFDLILRLARALLSVLQSAQ